MYSTTEQARKLIVEIDSALIFHYSTLNHTKVAFRWVFPFVVEFSAPNVCVKQPTSLQM